MRSPLTLYVYTHNMCTTIIGEIFLYLTHISGRPHFSCAKGIYPFHKDRNLFAEQKERLKRHRWSTALCRTDVKGPTYQIIRRLAVIDSKSASYPFVASQIHVSPIT
jgi:hypothetical protein